MPLICLADPMYDAFLQKICEQPDEDLPRLIYADWLEEQGHPRAEFIRLQIRLAREKIGWWQRRKLQRQERELLQTHQRAWDVPIYALWEQAQVSRTARLAWDPIRSTWEYRRGFPEVLHLSDWSMLRDFELMRSLMPVRHISAYFISFDWSNQNWNLLLRVASGLSELTLELLDPCEPIVRRLAEQRDSLPLKTLHLLIECNVWQEELRIRRMFAGVRNVTLKFHQYDWS